MSKMSAAQRIAVWPDDSVLSFVELAKIVRLLRPFVQQWPEVVPVWIKQMEDDLSVYVWPEWFVGAPPVDSLSSYEQWLDWILARLSRPVAEQITNELREALDCQQPERRRMVSAVLRRYASHPAELRGVIRGMVEERQVVEIVRRHQGGESQRALAKQFGCSQATVSRLVNPTEPGGGIVLSAIDVETLLLRVREAAREGAREGTLDAIVERDAKQLERELELFLQEESAG